MIPAERACSISFLIWASDGAPAATCRLPEPEAAGRRSRVAPTLPFSEEHEQLRDSVRGFLERELTPHAQRWEEEEWFPDEIFPLLAGQGLLGLKYPAEYGGQGGDYLHEAILCEELARVGSGGTAAGIRAHVDNAPPPDLQFGPPGEEERHPVAARPGGKNGRRGL